jgi:hypothetical protein
MAHPPDISLTVGRIFKSPPVTRATSGFWVKCTPGAIVNDDVRTSIVGSCQNLPFGALLKSVR